jgi:hypothetical protein
MRAIAHQHRKVGVPIVIGVVVVIIVVVSMIGVVLLSSGSRLITGSLANMIPTTSDLPGWTSGGGSSDTLSMYDNQFLQSCGFQDGYVASYTMGNNSLSFYLFKFSSTDGANRIMDNVILTSSSYGDNIYSASVGDEACGLYSSLSYDAIMFRKSNILATAQITGSGVSQGGSLSYAQLLASKIS